MNFMPVSIVELGNSLRCPEKGCSEFGKIMKLKVSKESVTLDMVCEKHFKSYSRKYSINQFVRMAESALIDKPWIISFQKNMLVISGEFIKIPKGMDGVFIVTDKKIVNEEGSKLICKCGSFASVSLVKIKGDKAQLNLYCSECMPKGKKIEMALASILKLGKAGLVDNDLVQRIKDEISQETEEFDTSTAYSVGKGIMAGWVQEELGMMDEGGSGKKCFICGTTVSETVDKCPKCGSDL